jgi:hypothetical protein
MIRKFLIKFTLANADFQNILLHVMKRIQWRFPLPYVNWFDYTPFCLLRPKVRILLERTCYYGFVLHTSRTQRAQE